MSENSCDMDRQRDVAIATGAEARLELYPIYAIVFLAGVVMLVSGSVELGGLILAIAGFVGVLRSFRHWRSDRQLSGTVLCAHCGRRLGRYATICPRCETKI
jgi:uncharacterized membrane protein YdfJ with MMPL/SSD domain